MLQENMLIWRDKQQQEWLRIGRQEGKLEGKQQGAASILTQLLRRRFGDVPEHVIERVAGAELPLLEAWTARILDAATLDEVFIS
ncbi:MAG: DUF4351 domain-containing protein [Magnetococcales bacterium]|nr:DUF4351 domain-containing protein [Magnetococcales bacterium]MBF0116934.1 DUF4351 domain-containing protein [Magnetococcales bacterium]